MKTEIKITMDKQVIVTRNKSLRHGRWVKIETNFSMKDLRSLNFSAFIGGLDKIEFENYTIWVSVEEGIVVQETIEKIIHLIFECVGFTCSVGWDKYERPSYD